MKHVQTVLLSMCLFMAASPGAILAEIFSYLDESGRRHYVDSVEKIPEQYRSQAQNPASLPPITRSKSALFSYENRPAMFPKAAARQAQVELFVTSWCPHCRSLEKALQEANVKFKRYDIEQDPRGKRIYEELGGGGVPVTRVGKTVIRGDQPKKVLKALSK